MSNLNGADPHFTAHVAYTARGSKVRLVFVCALSRLLLPGWKAPYATQRNGAQADQNLVQDVQLASKARHRFNFPHLLSVSGRKNTHITRRIGVLFRALIPILGVGESNAMKQSQHVIGRQSESGLFEVTGSKVCA